MSAAEPGAQPDLRLTPSQTPETWLASAAGKPHRFDAVIAWDRQPNKLAQLPCGIRWDVVRTPDTIGLPALETLSGSREGSLGPVLHDRRSGQLYWLIPVMAEHRDEWLQLHPEIVLLGADSYLSCPAPDAEPAADWPAAWAYWPHQTGTLTDPAALLAALGAHVATDLGASDAETAGVAP